MGGPGRTWGGRLGISFDITITPRDRLVEGDYAHVRTAFAGLANRITHSGPLRVADVEDIRALGSRQQNRA